MEFNDDFCLTPESLEQAQNLLQKNGQTLLLHMDVNGTIMFQDTTTAVETFNYKCSDTLAKCVHGTVIMRENIPTWIPYANDFFSPRKKPLLLEELTWHEYQYKYHCDQDWSKTSEKSKHFIEKEPVAAFLKPIHEKMVTHGTKFFQAYLNIMKVFPTTPQIFRSFGVDLPDVIDELKLLHLIPTEPSPPHYTATIQGYQNFANSERCSASSLAQLAVAARKKHGLLFTTVQEDFKTWHNHHQTREFGKCIEGCPNVFQIGFDDLDCMTAKGECAYVFNIRTMHAFEDQDYFVKRIISCVLQHFSKK